MSLNVLLVGAEGRLGKKIADLLEKDPKFSLVQKIGSPSSSLPSDIRPFLEQADVVVDVATPDSVQDNIEHIASAKKPFVIGCSGHNPAQKERIKSFSAKIPILLSANFAYGIAILKHVLPQLPKGAYSCIEKHHTEKKDAPSATALDLVQYINSSCKITSVRESDCIGEHKIFLDFENEEIEITHRAKNRDLFSQGALYACQFLSQKEKGLYT